MAEALLVKIVWLFLPLTLSHASTQSFSVVVPKTPVSGVLGGSVTLPCVLSENMDVSKFEVRWYRPSMYSSPALLYQNEKLQPSADVEHRGRVSLLGPLEKGDVSLKLDNLKVTDRGNYMCHVSSDRWYDKNNVSLIIEAVGSSPILSMVNAGEGKVNVSCQSHGWLPKPTLSWRDSDGNSLKLPNEHTSTKVSEGLFSVSSWLLFTSSKSSWVSCSVALPGSVGVIRESRVMPHVPDVPDDGTWKGAFIGTLILLLLCIIGVGVYFVLLQKGLIGSKRKKTEGKEAGTLALSGVEIQPLLNPQTAEGNHDQDPQRNQNSSPSAGGNHEQDHQLNVTSPPSAGTENQLENHRELSPKEPLTAAEWQQVKRFKVNITIDPEETPEFFRISHRGKRITCPQLNENPEEEDYKIFTLCREKFSSGQQYWELKVTDNKNKKISWFVGVATEEAERIHGIRLIPEKGFWVLCYQEGKGVYIRESAIMPTPLSYVSDDLSVVGVLLDCDNHTLSFYNTKTQSHIYTYTSVTPRTSLRPLISPGIRDKIPVHLLDQ